MTVQATTLACPVRVAQGHSPVWFACGYDRCMTTPQVAATTPQARAESWHR